MGDGNIYYWCINKSNEDIFIVRKIEQFGDICPDTLLPAEHPVYLLGDTIKKGNVLQKSFGISKGICDTIRIFILSIDTVNKYQWEQIRQDYNILKRYDITLNELETTNIYYPPNDNMKNIKMYPPYEE
jgi:hypothetical protein